MKKRILSVLLTIIMVTGVLSTSAYAAEPLRVLSLGDSITAGYGLANAESERFTALLGENYIVTNMAVTGNTTKGIADQIQNGAISKQMISDADIITITTGGNDMMGLIYDKMAATYNTQNNSNISGAEVSKIISKLNRQNLLQNYPLLKIEAQLFDRGNNNYFVNTQEFANALYSYQQALIHVTTTIRQINPDAKIIVATQYNPYAEFAEDTGFRSIYDGVEEWICKLNTTITNGAAAGGYMVADVKAAFDKNHSSTNDLYNANLTVFSLNLDFHPTAKGHKVLAEVFRNAITKGNGIVDLSSDTPGTRGEMITLLWQTAGSPAPKNRKMLFSDVPADSHYHDAVLWAVEKGITAGTSATTFSPNKNCTDAQKATFLQRFYNEYKGMIG